MEFMLLFHQPPRELSRKPEDPESASYWESWRAYMGAIYGAGIVKSGNALEPTETASTIRIREGQREVHDGPYPDTKEMLGGYLIIEVPSQEEDLLWAARSPSTHKGRTEVRPVVTRRLA